VIAIAGEVFLLLGLLLGAAAAGGVDIAAIRAALGTSGTGPVAIALLVAGFGIKAGLVPLHVWLPLAHPAAPVPASAVLSGAIVKAGLFGLILFLPDGAYGALLMGLGLTGAFGAALWGLTQPNPKAVLAYSTVSQMGLMVMFVGAGGAARELTPFLRAASRVRQGRALSACRHHARGADLSPAHALPRLGGVRSRLRSPDCLSAEALSPRRRSNRGCRTRLHCC
jgi:formate hydrogenlyase subunit 3/multisubunit Na+/H+ antiporter MnhD subunit